MRWIPSKAVRVLETRTSLSLSPPPLSPVLDRRNGCLIMPFLRNPFKIFPAQIKPELKLLSKSISALTNLFNLELSNGKMFVGLPGLPTRLNVFQMSQTLMLHQCAQQTTFLLASRFCSLFGFVSISSYATFE